MASFEEYDAAKSKVLRYVLYKKRTESEVRRKFSQTFEEELLDDIIEELKENGYINSKNYIRRAVAEYIALSNLSIYEIQYKLYSKGISHDDWEEYFYENKDELEDYELNSAIKVAIKKSRVMEKNEIKDFLKKKGYKKESIDSCLEQI